MNSLLITYLLYWGKYLIVPTLTTRLSTFSGSTIFLTLFLLTYFNRYSFLGVSVRRNETKRKRTGSPIIKTETKVMGSQTVRRRGLTGPITFKISDTTLSFMGIKVERDLRVTHSLWSSWHDPCTTSLYLFLRRCNMDEHRKLKR